MHSDRYGSNLLYLSSLVTIAFLIWKKYKWSTWLGLYYACLLSIWCVASIH